MHVHLKAVSKKGCVLLGLAGILALPAFPWNSYFMTLFCSCMINLIVVMGLNFITGMTGQPNFGSAGIYALGAYTSSLLTVKLGLSPWLSIFAVILMGLLIGLGLGYPSLRLKGVYLSITTIAFAECVRLLLTNLPDLTGGVNGVRNIPRYSIFGFVLRMQRHYYYFLVVVVLLLAIVARYIIRSKWGRAFFAIRDNIDAIESCGINVAQIKILAFTLAAVFGAIGGAMYAHFIGYINPIMFTSDMSSLYVVMLILGGGGKLLGNAIGAVLVTLLPEILRFLGDYYQVTYSLIVLLCVVLLPDGIFSIGKLRKRLRHRRKQSTP